MPNNNKPKSKTKSNKPASRISKSEPSSQESDKVEKIGTRILDQYVDRGYLRVVTPRWYFRFVWWIISLFGLQYALATRCTKIVKVLCHDNEVQYQMVDRRGVEGRIAKLKFDVDIFPATLQIESKRETFMLRHFGYCWDLNYPFQYVHKVLGDYVWCFTSDYCVDSTVCQTVDTYVCPAMVHSLVRNPHLSYDQSMAICKRLFQHVNVDDEVFHDCVTSSLLISDIIYNSQISVLKSQGLVSRAQLPEPVLKYK